MGYCRETLADWIESRPLNTLASQMKLLGFFRPEAYRVHRPRFLARHGRAAGDSFVGNMAFIVSKTHQLDYRELRVPENVRATTTNTRDLW